MKKAGICLFLVIMMISAVAFGEITHPIGPGQLGYDAVVISKSVSVRQTPNTNAKVVTKLSFGDHLAVMSLGNGWCEVYLSETEGLTGYVLEDFIMIDPAYIRMEESTNVYAWQATDAKRVGQLSRDENYYPIIRMEGNWLLISLRGAAGWILRPNGDTTGTARMKTSDVRKKAADYYTTSRGITAEELKEYYVFVEFDVITRQWIVTFDTRNNEVTEITVDDSTGAVGDYEPANG